MGGQIQRSELEHLPGYMATARDPDRHLAKHRACQWERRNAGLLGRKPDGTNLSFEQRIRITLGWLKSLTSDERSDCFRRLWRRG